MIKPDRPKRDELAKQISFLTPFKHMRRGPEAMQEFLRLEGKGANKRELFDETSRFADPGTETGIFRGADDVPLFELTDERMKLAPGLQSYFDFKKGGTSPILSAGQSMEAPDLFERLPGLKDVDTRFVMPEKDNGMGVKGEYWTPGTRLGNPNAYAEMRSDSAIRDINAPGDRSLRGLTAHEVGGHAVQEATDRPRGGMTNDPDMTSQFSRLVHPRAKAYKTELENFRKSTGLDENQFAEEFPEADDYLIAASTLHRPARGAPKQSALPYYDRYLNLSGESEGRRVAERLDMSAGERREAPPWLPILGQHAPYELQLLRSQANKFSMKDDKGTLARLMQKRPL